MRKLLGVVIQAGRDFVDDDCMSSGAAVAYYTIFSFPPLLVMVVLAAGMFGVTQEQIEQVVRGQMGIPVAQDHLPSGSEAAGDAGQDQQAEQQWRPGHFEPPVDLGIANLGWLWRVVGIGILLFSPTAVFAQLQFALNRTWQVAPDPEQGGIKNFLVKRVLSLGMILVIAFLLLVSLVLTTLIDVLIAHLQELSGTRALGVLATVLNNLAALAVATALFAAMFKIMPDAEISWRDIWVGSLVTGVLFLIGRSLIGLYIQHADLGSGWGAAAATSTIGVLVWVYYSSLILLFGAELTQVWANQYGQGMKPENGAVRKTQEERYIRDEQ
jgi:membrane protein